MNIHFFKYLLLLNSKGIEGSGEVSTTEKMKLFNNIFNLYDELQKEEKFRHSKEPVMHLIYHLSLKNYRSLKTMKIIMESKEIENSYIETLPLLRIQLETFFHLAYITKHENPTVCLEEYENLQKLQLRRIARNFKNLDEQRPNRLHDKEKQFMNLHKNKRISMDIEHLDKLWKLAQAADRYEEYVKIYSLLSSYVHYNPSTRQSYSNNKEKKIIYNQFIYNEQEETAILRHATGIGLLAVQSICLFLKTMELAEKTYLTFKVWEDIFIKKN